MTLLTFDSPEEFASLVGPTLEESEAENSLILGLMIRAGSERPDPLFMGMATDCSQIQMVGLIYGQSLVLTAGSELAIEQFVTELAIRHPDLPGVMGATASADLFSAKWRQKMGTELRNDVHHRIYSCTEVSRPRECRGSIRVASTNDLDMIERWVIEFTAEASPEDPWSNERARKFAITKVESQSLWFWEVDGAPVSMTATGRPTRNTITVNAVYTPGEFRNSGFASALVAEVTQICLDSGYREIVLYTDLANPTANSIYQKLGYRPIADSVHHWFNQN